MGIQVPLPGTWSRKMARRDPVSALEGIGRDKVEAMYAIEVLLDGLAEKHGISHTVMATPRTCWAMSSSNLRKS